MEIDVIFSWYRSYYLRLQKHKHPSFRSKYRCKYWSFLALDAIRYLRLPTILHRDLALSYFDAMQNDAISFQGSHEKYQGFLNLQQSLKLFVFMDFSKLSSASLIFWFTCFKYFRYQTLEESSNFKVKSKLSLTSLFFFGYNLRSQKALHSCENLWLRKFHL